MHSLERKRFKSYQDIYTEAAVKRQPLVDSLNKESGVGPNRGEKAAQTRKRKYGPVGLKDEEVKKRKEQGENFKKGKVV